ncbi:Glutamate--tRNA ligase 2 [Gammaproteobacteria bacterium]
MSNTHLAGVRARFAPSPTGELHIGNARTALYAALLARSTGGVFLIRSENTDFARSLPAYETALLTDLHWLGLEWQEGPDCGGPFGPYRQSDRMAIYAQWYSRLESEDLAYPCFCSEEILDRQRAAQRAAGKPPRYSGTCARLSHAEREIRRANTKPSLRMRVPRGISIEFVDAVCGPQRFQSDDLGDFVIRRADGTPSFLFANAIDDALMGVTHVLRGNDHLSNTPRQLLVLQALGLPAMQYGHLSLIVGNDGTPLSKRHHAKSLRKLREDGYFPSAILNHLVRLGHPYEDSSLLGLDKLAASFSLDRLGRAPARHDENTLWHWQRAAVAAATVQDLWDWIPSEVRDCTSDSEGFLNAVRPHLTMPKDAIQWGKIIYGQDLEYSSEACAAISAVGLGFYESAQQALETHGDNFKAFTEALKKTTGARGPTLFHSLRAALTGVLSGPELSHLWKLIPQEERRKRLSPVL